MAVRDEAAGQTDVAHIHEQARRSLRRGCFPKPTTARLMDVCGCWPDPGVYDAKILAWLANYEPGKPAR